MMSFKQFIKESIDAIAGVGFGEGENAKRYRFKVSDLIAHAEQKDEDGKDIYPVQHLDPKSMADNIEARRGSESQESERERTNNADVRFPIIATYRPGGGGGDDADEDAGATGGGIHVLDGTHRLEQAIKNKHETIPVRIIPIEHLEGFRI